MEAVDVLVGVDGEKGRELVEPLRERQLHQIGVDLGIGVEAGDDLVQLLLGGVLGQFGADRADADLLAVLVLQADIGGAGGVLVGLSGADARAVRACQFRPRLPGLRPAHRLRPRHVLRQFVS